MSGARCDCAGAPMGDPAGVVSALRHAGLTVAAGESITAGLVSATLAEVPFARLCLPQIFFYGLYTMLFGDSNTSWLTSTPSTSPKSRAIRSPTAVP